ncbi:MAG: GNAT family N-acetyltransferase, partial [Actinomycetota bacterium]
GKATVSDYEIQKIEAAEARPLRRALLHPSLPAAAVDYEADTHPSAMHVGAFKDGVLVGIASVHPQPMPSATRTGAWRIRDVAVEHGHRGRGVGAWMLERCLEHASATGGRVAWCAARVGAYGFFERLGFRRAGPPIDDPQDGPQYLMYVDLGPVEKSWKL